jgi:hypothetical protein
VGCPSDDLIGLTEVLARRPLALLPVGGVGDLGSAAGLELVLFVEVTAEGPGSSITWRARLGNSTPLEPDPASLLPATWVDRHPHAYALARMSPQRGRSEAEFWDDEDEPPPAQLFLPISRLERLPRDHWLFANELVPKQHRAGRRFAPSVPTIVDVPDVL